MNIDCFFYILIIELVNVVFFLVLANYNFKLKTRQIELKAKQVELQDQIRELNGKCDKCLKINNKYIHE